jgi:hypothetical protein
MHLHRRRQIQLLLSPASGEPPPFSDAWRNAFASRLREQGARPEDVQRLFHHTADGKTASGKPSICFIGSRTWMGVTAIGDASIDLVSSRVMDLIETAQRLVGPCSVAHHDLSLGLTYSSQPFSYTVRSYVGTQRDRDWTPLKLRDRLVNALNDWAQAHGIADPCDRPFEPQGVMLESVSNIAPAITQSSDGTRYVRSRVSLVFYMPWKLEGLWMVGSQTSKGHGLVRFVQSAGTRAQGATAYA